VHLEDFKFAELKWAKSSRMSKRWIVFTCRIQARRDRAPPSRVIDMRPQPPGVGAAGARDQRSGRALTASRAAFVRPGRRAADP